MDEKPRRHPTSDHPHQGGVLARRADGDGGPGPGGGWTHETLLRVIGRRVYIQHAIHRFWRERMRDAPSLDHAFACVLSGVEVERIEREALS